LPDLFQTENVWGIMATTVYADPEPQTLEALECRLREAWTSISVTTRLHLVSAVPNRLKVVIKGDTLLLTLRSRDMTHSLTFCHSVVMHF